MPENTTPAPTPDVDPSEVRDFLKAKTDAAPTPLDLDPAVAQQLIPAAAPAAPPEEEPQGVSETVLPAPDQPSPADHLRWVVQVPGMPAGAPDIEVTEDDKAVYAEHVLLEEPVVLDIPMPGLNAVVTVTTLTPFEQDVLFAAVDKDIDDKKISTPAQRIGMIQRYAVVMQVMRVKNTAFSRFVVDCAKPIAENVPGLRECMEVHMRTMSATKFDLLLLAVQIMDAKLQRLSAGVLRNDFFVPAGSA